MEMVRANPSAGPPPRVLLRFVKNAIANVLSGGAAAVLTVALPPFLVRLMSTDEFAVWALILQLAATVNLFRFGVEIALGRLVSESLATGDDLRRNRIVTAALALLALAGLVAIALVVWLSGELGRWFGAVPPDLLRQARPTLLIVGITLSLGLPASAFAGVLAGLQRYEVTALVRGPSKLLAGFCLVLAAAAHSGLVVMAICWAVPNLLGAATLVLAGRRACPGIRIAVAMLHRAPLRETLVASAGLSAWSVAMIMINGLDNALVGHFDFANLAYYSLASSLVALLAGVQEAVFASLVPLSAAMNSGAAARQRLGSLLSTSTRYGAYLLLALAVPLLWLSFPILRIWVGLDYAYRTQQFLVILVIANCIRLVATPFATILAGTGQQLQAVATSLLEGVVNLVASILLGLHYGATGVAVGTLVGALVGISGASMYTLPKTRPFIQTQYWELFRDGVGRPLLVFVPLLLAYGLMAMLTPAWNPAAAAVVLSGLALSGLLFWRYGCLPGERMLIQAKLRLWAL